MTTARSAAPEDSEALERPARHRPPDRPAVRRPVLRPRPERSSDPAGAGAEVVEAEVVVAVEAVAELALPDTSPGEAPPEPVGARPRPAAGAQHRRRLSHRRRRNEAVLILLVVFIALGVTVFLLASQWLQSAATSANLGAVGGSVELPLSTAS